jgi:hypothetical protein
MARTKLVAVLVVGIALAGCSSGSPDTPAGPATGTAGPRGGAAPSAGQVKCAELFVDGQRIDEARVRQGCVNASGAMITVQEFPCRDGRYLFQLASTSGAPEGWGLGGDVYHAKSLASDPAYAAAYQACVG